MRKSIVIIGILFATKMAAQSQSSGWMASFNTIGLANRFSMHFDGQMRSSDQWEELQTILLRPGLNYHARRNISASLGYAYVGNRREVDELKLRAAEHRIWQQLILSHNWLSVATAHRFRLEQRFVPTVEIEDNELIVTERDLTHRFRYFVRNVLPLQKDDEFTKGFFAAVQNEVFLNVANDGVSNGKFFDQNRLYGAIGYRLGKKIDVESGYLNQFVRRRSGSTTAHVLQFAVYTRL